MKKHPSAKVPVTIADLDAAIANIDEYERSYVFERYCKQKPGQEAIPLLRRALADDNKMTVRCAAISLRKLGPAATEAVDDLFEAGARTMTHPRTGLVLHYPVVLPQAYPQCIEAIAAIQPTHSHLLGFIKGFTGTDNWGLIGASLRTLRLIGTPEALALLRRIAAFWLPEFNKMQTRVVEEILAEIGDAKA